MVETFENKKIIHFIHLVCVIIIQVMQFKLKDIRQHCVCVCGLWVTESKWNLEWLLGTKAKSAEISIYCIHVFIQHRLIENVSGITATHTHTTHPSIHPSTGKHPEEFVADCESAIQTLNKTIIFTARGNSGYPWSAHEVWEGNHTACGKHVVENNTGDCAKPQKRDWC